MNISLLQIAENQDVFQRHLITYLSINEFVGLQSVSKGFRDLIDHELSWKFLYERDLGIDSKAAPHYNPHTKSFDTLREQKTYKQLYMQWSKWQQQTCYGIEPHHMIQSIEVWARFKKVLRDLNLTSILDSLMPPPSREFFETAAGDLPSSLIAFYAIHAGQRNLTPNSSDGEFFAGLFGSYSCYNSFYSMRLYHVIESAGQLIRPAPKTVVIGMNLGLPRTYLLLDYDSSEGPEGSIYIGFQSITRHLVGRGGILSYFQTYTERLERKKYQPAIIHPDSPSSLGISLFPDTGDMVGVATTNGIEVRSSARWFPERTHGGMNFGYSIRIRLVGSDSVEFSSCQLVDRTWEFHYENGSVNRVSGEGVIGKQPIFFRTNDGRTGFDDMGPAGTGERKYETFSYQSQSGPVPGTSSHDVANTTRAFVRGTFSFRPGSIESPTGPLFLVTVADFPLNVTLPFY